MNKIYDVNDNLQRKSILKICSQILSIPFAQINSSIPLEDDGYFNENDDRICQEVFQKNNVRVVNRYILNDVQNRLYTRQLYIEYDKDTLKNIIPICKSWFTPLISDLKKIDKEKRNEWTQNHDINNSAEGLKSLLINSPITTIPGFNYLIDIHWDNEDRKNSLIFGSDYGIYLTVETQWLNMNHGQRAKRLRDDARIDVKERARRLKEFAIAKYGNVAIKIIGASYTNDNENEKLQFVDNQDKEIARIIGHLYHGGKNVHLDFPNLGFGQFWTVQNCPIQKTNWTSPKPTTVINLQTDYLSVC
ncbi:19150_t:CDS:2 [Rhizophagus irregularis]|nr:19150_t:CDS:2 [Rhizophagus irregularis]